LFSTILFTTAASLSRFGEQGTLRFKLLGQFVVEIEDVLYGSFSSSFDLERLNHVMSALAASTGVFSSLKKTNVAKEFESRVKARPLHGMLCQFFSLGNSCAIPAMSLDLRQNYAEPMLKEDVF
jgi:hypothetical protein